MERYWQVIGGRSICVASYDLVSDLERQDVRYHIFRRISLITPVLFDVERRTQQDNMCGEGQISRGSATLLPQGGRAPVLPNFLNSLLFMHTPFDADGMVY